MLEIKHLTKAYDHTILNDVSMSFNDHGLYVILGESGCGKSTLLNMLGGLDHDYQGTIKIDGKEIRAIHGYIRKYVGFIFQQFHLIEEMNVKENENLSMYFKKENDAQKANLLTRLNLEKIQKYKTKILSGGQKQRVAIYRSFVPDHPIILCDEPTGALDSKNSEEVFKILKELSKEKLVIVISHDEKLANKYHDVLYQIKDQQVQLIHENKMNQLKITKTKETKKSFLHFLFKDFFLSWKSHLLVIEVLFIAILSIMLTLSLTKSTNQQIHYQLEQIIPSTTIMLKKKNNTLISENDLKKIKQNNIQYHFLQNDDIEFLGISLDKKYQEKRTLYISDYIQKPQQKIKGRRIQKEQEIILSKSTYEQLLYITKKKSLMNQDVYMFFDYKGKIKYVRMKIVGVEEKETLMETVYFKEYAFNHMIEKLYGLNEGHSAFLQVKNKNMLNSLKQNYPLYDFKIANSSLSSTIDDKFQQIEAILLCFSSLSIVTGCFLLGVVLYLMVVKRKKYFAILQTLGASLTQVSLIVLFQGMTISFLAFLQASFVLKKLFDLGNVIIKESVSNLIGEFFTISNEMVLTVVAFVLVFTLLCTLIPVKKVKQIDIVESLKG